MVQPTQKDPQFKLRFTQKLRDAIETSAKDNNRSMNAEIVARLERTFTSKEDSKLANDFFGEIMDVFMKEGLINMSKMTKYSKKLEKMNILDK